MLALLLRLRACALLVLPAALVAPLAAQLDRYELGLRLRAYEQRLGASTDQERTAASLRELDRAVQAFFRFDLQAVARAVDAADRRLLAAEPDAATTFARSVQFATAARLCDPQAGPVAFTLAVAFPTDAPCPEGLVLDVAFDGDGKPRASVPVRELPCTGLLPLADAALGERTLAWTLRIGERVLLQRSQGLSLAADLAPRLAALATATEDKPANDSLEAVTAPLLAKQLATMTKAKPEETVLPGARLLADAEAMLAANAKGAPFFGPDRVGEHWLRVPLRRGAATVRLLVPPDTKAEAKRPLVLAMHGAGGSENMFFDSYGAGAIVALCQARGWYLVAPRSELLGSYDAPQLIDALAARWPIDASRVLLVGHSMGAGQAASASSRAPERFTAVALLGGGGGIGKGLGLAGRPFFVGAGERDFGRGGALTLHKALVKAGADASWREYPDVEHLAIVQFALPDVFAFFDAALQPKAEAGK